MIDMKQFGTKLKLMIHNQGMSCGKFADSIGITRQALSNYISGRHYPKLDVLLLICNALDVSIDYMCEHSGNSQISYEQMVSHIALTHATNKELIDEFRYRIKKGYIKPQFVEVSYSGDD